MSNLILSNDEILIETAYSDKKYDSITVNINEQIILSPEALNKLFLCTNLNAEIIIKINKKLENEYANDVKVNLKFAGFKVVDFINDKAYKPRKKT